MEVRSEKSSAAASGLSWIAPLVLGGAALGVFYGSLLAEGSRFLFSIDGDGLKNYHTFIYHVLYDADFLRFGGMNYPFGEHILFADAQPVVSIPLQIIHQNVADLTAWMPGLVNLVMLASPVVAGVAISFLLLRFGLPLWQAALAATGIAFLNPEMARIAGHYSLTQFAALPLTWLLLLRFWEKPSLRRNLAIPVNTLFWTGFHVYFLALITLMLGCFWILKCAELYRRQSGFGSFLRDKERSWLGPVTLQILAAPIVLFLVLWVSDPHLLERFEGVRHADTGLYAATFEGVAVPLAKPFGPGLEQKIAVLGSQAEGIAYLGMPVLGIGSTVLLVLLWASFFRADSIVWKRARLDLLSLAPGSIGAGLLVGVAALVLAAGGLPKFLGSGFLPIMQFRSVGRFAWLFYLSAAVFSFVALSWVVERLRQKGARWLGWVLMVAVFGMQFYEVFNYSREIVDYVGRRGAAIRNRYSEAAQPGDRELAWLAEIDRTEYQAVLPLPFFHIGSDMNFSFLGNEQSIRESMLVSMDVGIPMIAAHLARTAPRQAEALTSLISGKPEPGLRARFDPGQQILVIATLEGLTPHEEALSTRGRVLFDGPQLRIRSVTVEELFN